MTTESENKNGETKESFTEKLQAHKSEASAPPPTEAKAALGKALAAVERAYMEFPGIRAAYAAQYPLFIGSIYKAARDQHDEAKSAIDDSDEIAEELKTEIADLQKTYGKRAYTSKTTRHSSIEELDKTRSPLAAAEGKVAEAQAELDKAKAFEKRAKAWFDDVKKLSNDVKASRDAGNMRLAYAQYLELKDVFEDRIQKKFRPDASTPADPDWLLRKLNARLKALLDAEYARYQASAAAADASANAKTAEAEYKAFVQENGRRTAFLREAQDAPAPKESGSTTNTTSTAGSTRQTAPAE